MRNAVFYTCLVVFVLIQAIDMELTQLYIGDSWWMENCWTMRVMIKEFGIFGALAVCRLATFFFLLVILHYRDTKLGFNLLLLSTLCYFTWMLPWAYSLGYVDFPFPDLT